MSDDELTRLLESGVFEEVTNDEMQFGIRRPHRKEITVPVARKRNKQTPWSRSMETRQWEARRELRHGPAGNPFIVWDGEGCNDSDGTMSYVLLGHSAGVQDNGPRYITHRRLSTLGCLQFIWNEGKRYKDYFHVSFGFNFDVDQILRDIPDEYIQKLKDTNKLDWRGYRLFFIPRKMFSISYLHSRQRVTIFDTITFFNTNLVNTAKLYVPQERSLIELVADGKAGRSSFDFSELHSVIIPYWKKEGYLMSQVMNALRHSLTGAGITLEKWHGPGAIAESLIKRENLATHIKESRVEMPDEVTTATAHAFFGGRFECNIIGRIPGPVYSYDIRSAYPYGLTKTGALTGGKWVPTLDVHINGIYHVINHGHPKQTRIGKGPLPHRNEKGLVAFPFVCEGWYFGPEIVAAQMTGWHIEIVEGWAYVDGDPSPFLFLQEMYLQRQEFKREGNPAQLACKLGPNSIFGKLAQLVGWDEENTEPPEFHHQWYAGMTTSYTRAMIWLAMSQKPNAIIACETDGIYSTHPLDVRIGHQLGEWEVETYDGMVYAQSGMYFGRRRSPVLFHEIEKGKRWFGDEWIKARTRGISRGNVGVDDVLRTLPSLEPFTAVQHRYGSLTGSLGSAKRFTWYDQESKVEWGLSEKRGHIADQCYRCRMGDLWNGPDVHYTSLDRTAIEEMSSPRLIPWVDKCINGWYADIIDESYEAITGDGL